MQTNLNIEAKFLKLGDKRRNERFFKVIDNHVQNPAGSIPEVNRRSKYGMKAEYNFYSTNLVEEEKLQTAVFSATVERACTHPVLLIAHDTSNISFGHNAEGLGVLDHGVGRGVIFHHSFVVTPEEEIIGEIHQQMWERSEKEIGKKKTREHREIEDKESYKWIEGFRKADLALSGEYMKVHIADREADVYEVMATQLSKNAYFLIRGTHKRNTDEGKEIWTLMENDGVKGKSELLIKRGKEREQRIIKVEYYFRPVKLLPPKRKSRHMEPIEVNVILVKEEKAPNGVKGIQWLLYTTLPIHTLEDAIKYVGWYSKRWLIERFHFILKSGCKLEELQLSRVEQLRKAIITYTLIATRLMWLTYYSRLHPETPCNQILDEHEWQALYFSEHNKIPPQEPPSIKDALLWIAKLGGFIGRKSDGDPGVETTWRGLKMLDGLAKMWRGLQNEGYAQ